MPVSSAPRPWFAGGRPGYRSTGYPRMYSSDLLPSARALRALDATLTAWVLIWIGLGIAIGINLDDLTGLSHTVSHEGHAVETIGAALRPVAALPIVGASVSQAATEVQRAGASAVASGGASASSIERLSVLIAIAVALLPSVPVFGLYVPLRLQRRREARAVHEPTGDVRGSGG